MIQDKEVSAQVLMNHLEKLFTTMDTSGDGTISMEEFRGALQDPRVKHWLGAMDFEVADVESVFALIDDGSGGIDRTEFMSGLKRLKGSARNIDMFSVMQEVSKLRNQVVGLREELSASRLAAAAAFSVACSGSPSSSPLAHPMSPMLRGFSGGSTNIGKPVAVVGL